MVPTVVQKNPCRLLLLQKQLLVPSKAWGAAAREAKKPLLIGVQHGKRLFTPASSLQKNQVDTKTHKFLQKCSQPKKKACKAYKDKFVAAARDNVAEGLVSNLKHTARRLNSLRGGRVANSNQKSVTAQSSATLLRQAGLYSVLESAKLFREARSNGTLTLSPRDAFDYQKHGWLTGDAENASKLEEAEERTA